MSSADAPDFVSLTSKLYDLGTCGFTLQHDGVYSIAKFLMDLGIDEERLNNTIKKLFSDPQSHVFDSIVVVRNGCWERERDRE